MNPHIMHKPVLIYRLFLPLLLLYLMSPLFSQNKVQFTLDKIIRIAKEQAPDAILARHRFRASYWQYRSFQAIYMPSLKFDATLPSIDRSIRKNALPEILPDSSVVFIDQYSRNNSSFYSGSLSLSQNIGVTGGNISLNSGLERTYQIGVMGSKQFAANPVVNITFNQPLFAFNGMKWDRKIQPLAYEEAKKNYLEAMEQVSVTAIERFFDLADAQLSMEISQINFKNNDTLYKIAQDRFNIGAIAENDLLQMQLSFLNTKTELTKAIIDLEMQKSRLRSFLGYNEKVDFNLLLPDSILNLKVDYQKVLELALNNNPEVIGRQLRLIEANRDLAQAKGQRQNINLSASLGLSKSTYGDIASAYDKPGEGRQMRIGISVPLIDWGQGRGKVKIAQSNQELINMQVQQSQLDFEQNIFLLVMQFNLQNDQVTIAAKSDTIGQKRYDITKQRFLIGKVDALNLTDALHAKDIAKRGYVDALRSYWNAFFMLRITTLFDFIKNQTLSEEFDNLIE